MNDFIGKHIRIVFYEKSPSGKTSRWIVYDAHGSTLGGISWYAAWRKYVYQPNPQTVYEETCLREIAAFVESQTKLHKSQ